MAKNRKTDIDNVFEAPVPAGTKSGDPVCVFGVIPAIAQTDEGAGVGNVAGRASVDTQGIHACAVPEAVNTEGTAIHYVVATKVLTTTVGSNPLFGYTIHLPSPVGRTGGTKAAGAGVVNIRLAKV